MSAIAVPTLWRRFVLLLALIASIAATLWSYRNEQHSVSDESVHLVTSIERKSLVAADINLEARAASVPTTINAPGLPNGQALSQVSTVPERADRMAAKVLLDPFAPLAVAPPPLPRPEPAPIVTAPTAPPLPFKYMGRLDQPKKFLNGLANPKTTQGAQDTLNTVVYLARGEEAFSVSAGESVDANYRFVGIEGENLVFMYLPLSQRQTLPIEQ